MDGISDKAHPDGTRPDYLDGVEIGRLSLMDGESVNTAFHLKAGLEESADSQTDMLYLTDRRILRLYANGRNTKVEVAAVADVETVDVSKEKQGPGAFVWGFLGIVAAFFLWLVIDHPVGSAAAAAAVALLAVYLIADRLTQHTTAQITFNMHSAQLRADLKGDRAITDVYAFIARLYQVKDDLDRRAPPKFSGYPPA